LVWWRLQPHTENGIGLGIGTFLPALQLYESGVPWHPSTDVAVRVSENFLYDMGMLAYLRRLARMERYGLGRCEKTGEKSFRLIMPIDTSEMGDRVKLEWLTADRQKELGSIRRRIIERKKWAARRVEKAGGIEWGWYIRYDADPAIKRYYQDLADLHALESLEGEALPDDVKVGPLTFKQWREAAGYWYGRMLYHKAFAARLSKIHKNLRMRDLLTLFWRRDDLLSDWQESCGLDAHQAQSVIDAGMLTAENVALWNRDDEIPTPFYIDFGKHFVLLPYYGVSMNPFATIVQYLKREYRTDWDSGVDHREEKFREQIAELFPEPRYAVPGRSIKIKGSDGNVLTDIDVVVLDRKTGSLALIQVKWQDVFGLSLREHHSRYQNLLSANTWVDKVSDWVAGRTSSQIAGAFGIKGNSPDREVKLFVLARYAIRFTGNTSYDRRAAWLTWPDLVHARKTMKTTDLIEAIWQESSKGAQHLPGFRVRSSHEVGGYTFEVGTEDGFP